MDRKKDREDAIEDLTLALLYLTRFSNTGRFNQDSRFQEIAWKGYDFDALNRLDGDDLIFDPHTRRHASKYVYLTEKGRRKAAELLKSMGIADKELYERFEFRTIRPEEADEAADLEAVCFPPNETCSRDDMTRRVEIAPELFLTATNRETGTMAGFLNGVATNETEFRDEFFTDASLHIPDGENVMLLGLDVSPEYRKQGLARELVWNYCRREQEKGRKELVLTCHANKMKMYKKFGFHERGESRSSWGGEKWREMAIRLNF